MANRELEYAVKNQSELNLSYMPFINNGGLFIPTTESYALKEKVTVNLILLGQTEKIEGKVVWIIPKNSLYHVYQGIGVQFLGENAESVREYIEANLDSTMEIGGYVLGMMNDMNHEG